MAAASAVGCRPAALVGAFQLFGLGLLLADPSKAGQHRAMT
jgi:hypothetical protein